ncbi:Transferrin [Eumeta japonica]|uniref:Transferrin n=1 Tax=Eumeta variegata TaxID=151549 RepID=A0A4C1YMG2_EUMVA|nr:Transferrin [Eumeta japonica]
MKTWWPSGDIRDSNTFWEHMMFYRMAGVLHNVLVYQDALPSAFEYISSSRNLADIDVTSFCMPTQRWCTISEDEQRKCEWVRHALRTLGVEPALSCQRGQSPLHCLRDIRDNNADFIAIDSNYGYLARHIFDLSPLLMVNHWDKYMTRVAALVRSNSGITRFENLRGKKACFPEFGGNSLGLYAVDSEDSFTTRHTIIFRDNLPSNCRFPVYTYALFYHMFVSSPAFLSFVATGHNKSILSTSECNYAKAVAEFFKGTCAPGALDSMRQLYNSSFDVSSLCDVCKSPYPAAGNGTDFTCKTDWTNMYYGNDGALTCLADQSADVAFVDVRDLDGSDDGVRRLVPELTYHNGTIYPNHIWACWNGPEMDFDHDWLSGSDDGTSKLPAPLSDPESQSWSKCIPREYQQVQTWLDHLARLNIPADTFRPLCSGNNSLGKPGTFVNDDCLMSQIINSEVMVRRLTTSVIISDVSTFCLRNDSHLVSLTSLLNNLKHYIGHGVPVVRRLIDLQVCSTFDGIHDLLFKDSVDGLFSPSFSRFSLGRDYFQLLEHLDSCTGSVDSLFSNGVFSHLSLVFVSLLSIWLF